MRIRKVFFIVLLLGFLAFIVKGILLLDPDFGWHYKMGEVITTSGIPLTDPFSYTMPSFPFVDHEWLTNVVIYFLYSWIGYYGLAVLYAFLALFALFLALTNPLSRKHIQLTVMHVLLFILGVGALVPFAGIRPQVESWVLLTILLYRLLNNSSWHKWRRCVPLFFLFWANFHGSFGMGILVLLLFVILKSIRMRTIAVIDIAISGLSIGATFLNPYGIHIWGEFWQQASDSNLRWSIGEWMPAIMEFNISFLMLLGLSGILLWKYREKYLLEEKGLYLAFLFQSFASVRNIPLWVMLALPMTVVGFDFFNLEIKKVSLAQDRLNKVLIGGSVIIAIFVGISSFLSIRHLAKYNENSFYPHGAISYLKEHETRGNLFADYGYGGYLIWKLPEKKVFIDGRMPSWHRSDNVPNEESYTFKTYRKILSDEINYKEIFEKYTIDTTLFPKNQKKNSELDKFFQDTQNYLNEALRKGEKISLVERLENDGWIKVYEDEVSQIYQNPNMIQ